MVHFFHRNIRDTMIILEEGNLPHPSWTCFNMLVPWKALSGRHTTEQCTKGAEQKRCRLVVEEMRESTATYFQSYIRPLESVTSFKCLEQIMTDMDDDWMEVV